VDAARWLGFVYKGTKKKVIYLNIRGRPYEVKLLHIFPFDHERKRMAIIVDD
jgi:magnesium-transporting ATPase (P-type)